MFIFGIDSTNIFDTIPPLPDKDMEAERQDVYNYCFSLDIKYNNISKKSIKLIDRLRGL